MTRVRIAPETTEASASRRSAGGSRRSLLWLLLVISLSGNLVASVAVNALVGSAFGLVAVCCGAALVSDHYRNRRR